MTPEKYWAEAMLLASQIQPEVAAFASKWWAARLWYHEAGMALREVFGDCGRTVAFVAAALSPETRVGEDVRNAIRLIRVAELRGWAGVIGEHRRSPLHKYGQQVRSAFNCWVDNVPPNGAKIRPFAMALVAEPLFFPHCLPSGEPVPMAVVDRHMTRPFFGGVSPSEVQRRAVSLACLWAGQGMGLDGFEAVRQVQAASWHEGASRGRPVSPETIEALSYGAVIRGSV